VSQTFYLPIRTVNPLNTREHWSKRAKRSKAERRAAYLATYNVPLWPSRVPIMVSLTRIAPRKMDCDGCTASFKAIRDGIADKLGVDDGSESIRFSCAQRKGKEYGIEVTIE